MCPYIFNNDGKEGCRESQIENAVAFWKLVVRLDGFQAFLKVVESGPIMVAAREVEKVCFIGR